METTVIIYKIGEMSDLAQNCPPKIETPTPTITMEINKTSLDYIYKK